MLTREENELLCRIEPGTAMGGMLRRYWIPAIRSSELPGPDCNPVAVRLLGENLVAFRDTSGRVGILDDYCPHRGAGLHLGRNEEGGLRCLYHGWKMDVEGTILETPTEPAGSVVGQKIKALSYLVHEQGGFVWVYMGPAGSQPVFPEFAWTTVPDGFKVIRKVHLACNWIQTIEGGIDSAHGGILHSSGSRPAADISRTVFGTRPGENLRPTADLAPRLEADNTDYGFRYAAVRTPLKDPETTKHIRLTAWIAPFYTHLPNNTFQIFVPIDDNQTWYYLIMYSRSKPIDAELLLKRNGVVPGVDVDEKGYKIRTLANNFLQDRDAMRRGESFTGIPGTAIQDAAVQETMGTIYDRTREHLGASDIAVIRMRRLMLDSVANFSQGGVPIGLDKPVAYSRIKGAEGTIPLEAPWQSLLPDDAVPVR